MRRSKRIVLGAMAALAPILGACSSDLSLNNLTLVPKPETLMRKPDWATFSSGRNNLALRPVINADLVNADGQCAAAPEQATEPGDPAVAAPFGGGIALRMTECEVVQRAGPVEQLDIGANERGERTVVLTYLQGPSPGVYRFAGGRLVSIERTPAPAKPQKPTAKKPAT
jgi:hypothetical protein